MKLPQHLVISASVSVALYVFLDVSAVIGCMIGGVLIDIDHFIDTTIYKKRFVGIKEFFLICNTYELKNVTLVFHSVEISIVLLLIMIIVYPSPVWLIGFTIGYIIHLLCDIYYNPVHWYAYFFLHRLLNGFKSETYFNQEKLKRGNKTKSH